MANFAKLTVEFTSISDIDADFSVRFTKTSPILETWTCDTLRTSAYAYTQGTSTADQGSKARDAVSADISNNGSLSPFFNVSGIANGFEITATEYGWTIENTNVSGEVNATFTEVPEVLPAKNFELTGYTLAAGTLPCSDIELTITENDGVAPYTWVSPSNASTSLIAQIARGTGIINVTLQDSEADQATLNTVEIPPIFTSVNITDISVVTNAGGLDATVTVFMDNPNNVFTFAYSLDGINFQSSNVFPSVLDGDYTLYVGDGFGCTATTLFTVDTAASIQRDNPYYFVSKANPLRWVQLGINKYQTLDNTLYQNEYYLGQFKPRWAQPYQTNDGVIINQFRTNYDELTARILDCNDNLIQTLSVDKKSDNIGAQDKRSCTAFDRGNNQAGLYFTTGNIYEPGTDTIIDTYELNGGLPEWGKVGNTVTLTGSIAGSFVIKQVVFDSSVQANALIFDYSWMLGNTAVEVVAECTYNRQVYETYEFDFDLSTLPVGVYYAQLIMDDSLSEYPQIVHNTDYFEVATYHSNTNFIDYSESDRTGVDYSTGFIGRIRVRSLDAYANMNPGGELSQYTSSEGELTTLKATATMEGVFYIEMIPKGFIEKFNIIFRHNNVLINGEEWTMQEFETIPLEKNALKSLNITLSRNNYNELNTLDIDIHGDLGTIDTQEDNPILQ